MLRSARGRLPYLRLAYYDVAPSETATRERPGAEWGGNIIQRGLCFKC